MVQSSRTALRLWEQEGRRQWLGEGSFRSLWPTARDTGTHPCPEGGDAATGQPPVGVHRSKGHTEAGAARPSECSPGQNGAHLQALGPTRTGPRGDRTEVLPHHQRGSHLKFESATLEFTPRDVKSRENVPSLGHLEFPICSDTDVGERGLLRARPFLRRLPDI